MSDAFYEGQKVVGLLWTNDPEEQLHKLDDGKVVMVPGHMAMIPFVRWTFNGVVHSASVHQLTCVVTEADDE